MINGLWLGLMLAFGVAADYTVQKYDWSNMPPLFEVKKEIIVDLLYYDKIEQVGYDMYLPVKDSTYVYTIKRKRK